MSTTNLYVVNGLPTYGNWGGPGRSAGEQVPAGAHLTDAQKAVDGIDGLDRLFKAHDIAYDEASKKTDPLAQAQAILAADMQLMGGMWALGSVTDPLEEDYRIAAMDVFDKKLVRDILGVASNNVDNFLSTKLPQIDASIRASTGGTYRVVYYSYDPLVLDLDGDGIETVASNGLAGALFDQNGDGIRTATGWVKSDDGILVRDINGNGTIDNGSEVFGDSTALAAGGTAADGFAALSGMDSNGDGVVNSADANFSQLQIWRDLNQNGVSDAGELFTLQQSGIQSLNTAAANATPIAVAGGILAETGSYMRTDGTVSTMGDVSGRVAAQQRGTHRPTPCGCNLAADTFQRSFTNVIPTTPQTAALHDMQGGGAGNDVYLFECSSGQGAIIHAANETMFEVRTVG